MPFALLFGLVLPFRVNLLLLIGSAFLAESVDRVAFARVRNSIGRLIGRHSKLPGQLSEFASVLLEKFGEARP